MKFSDFYVFASGSKNNISVFNFFYSLASTQGHTPSIFELFDRLDAELPPDEQGEMANEQEDNGQVANEQVADGGVVRPNRVFYKYIHENTFDNEKDFQDFLDNEKCWKVHIKLTKNDGVKTIHWCKLVKCRGPRCLAEIYTIHDRFPGDTSILLFRRVQEHTHDTSPNKVQKLSQQMKDSIEKYVGLKITPKPMIQQLRIDFPDDPATKKQILAYYKKHRKDLFGRAKISVEDMISACKENEKVPEDFDTAFVLDYQHSPIDDGHEENVEEDNPIERAFDKADETAEKEASEENAAEEEVGEAEVGEEEVDEEDVDEEFDEPWIRYIVTTKRLLQNSLIANNICADATKKIVVQKYPIFVFGTEDMDSTQHFHLVAVMISKYERGVDFEFGFRAIQEGYRRILEKEFVPKYLMRDGAFAIHNGCIRVFGDLIISLMCYVHVIRAVDRQPVTDPRHKADIKKDVFKLRCSYDKATFDKGCQLFLEKWAEYEQDFATYFENTWIRHNSQWFNGASYRMVSTNNGLENWNGGLKRYHTHWKITGLNQFKIDLMTIVSKESTSYKKGDTQPFKQDVVITNRTMKAGHDLSKFKSIVFVKGDDGKGRCYLRKGEDATKLNLAQVETFLEHDYQTFDEFAEHLFDIYTVTLEMNANTWKDTATCTCIAFADYYMCKHILCMVYKLGLEKYKGEHFLNPNKTPGRPRNATPALVIE